MAGGERRTSPRTYLFVPGDAEAKLEKALSRGADALIVDLEDAVAASSKARAREVAQRFLAELPGAEEQPVEIWVRVNPGAMGRVDVEEVLGRSVRGVCLAKVDDVAALEVLDGLLADCEERHHLRPGSLLVQAQLESARALCAVGVIARGPRVVQLQLGEVDLAADCGIEPDADERELLFARGLVVIESAAAGLPPPVGPVWVDVQDLEGFRRSSIALRRLGFRSRACIHPAQVPIAGAVFTPSEAEIEAARVAVAAYEEALARGVGVVTDPSGRMVDEAVVRSSRRILATLGRAGDGAGTPREHDGAGPAG